MSSDVVHFALAGGVEADLLSIFELQAVAFAEPQSAVLALSGDGAAAAAQAAAALAACRFAVFANFGHAGSGFRPQAFPPPTSD